MGGNEENTKTLKHTFMVEWRKAASFFLVPLSSNNIEQTNAEKIKLIRKKKRQNQIRLTFFQGKKQRV